MRGDLWCNTGHQSNQKTLAKSSISWKPCSWHNVSCPSVFLPVSKREFSVAAQLWHSWAMVWAQSSALCAGWQLSFSRTVLGKGSSSCFPFQGKCMLTWMSITWIICKSQVSCIFRLTVNGKAYVANGCSFLLRSGLALVASCSSWWPALKSRSQSSSLSYKIFYNPHCNVPVGKKTR